MDQNAQFYVNSFHATFDIDNDGHKETVVWISSSVGDVIDTNMLLIYKTLDLSRRFTSKTYASHSESIDLNGSNYDLTACKNNPTCFPNGIEWAKDWKARSIWPAFVIHPFFYKNKTYISIRDSQPPDRRSWLVITRYFGGKVRDRARKPGTPVINPESIDDQCYLERISKSSQVLDNTGDRLMLATLHANFLKSSYTLDRDVVIKVSENIPLFQNPGQTNIGPQLDLDTATANAVIGYGYDLRKNSLGTLRGAGNDDLYGGTNAAGRRYDSLFGLSFRFRA